VTSPNITKQPLFYSYKKILTVIILLSSFTISAKYSNHFTLQDSLRGNITPERIWWDLQQYDLSISINPSEKFIRGKNTISYKVLSKNNRLQIDLQKPMSIKKVTQDGQNLSFLKNGNIYYINLIKEQTINHTEKVTIYFEGNPKVSKNPPWDAAFTWKKDINGIDFIATSCQGEGASMWWPCKDHMYDEPDFGVTMQYTVPENLMAIGNGRLVKTTSQKKEKTKTYYWKVISPINNYGVHLSVGNYIHFSDKYEGLSGLLDCNYYVLKQHYSKAKKHFKETKRTLDAFEYWFGPYPFYEDSYKLVEVPYLGMEHQSAVTYGNGYQNGYLGQDISATGWGLKFDYIIVHESGHEWFANSITYKDVADMWIHEGFTCYAETLFLEYHYGKKAANEYNIGLRKGIKNDKTIIGIYNLNQKGSNDMYSKGANMLHTIRQVINDDNKWRLLLRALNQQFFHKTVSSKQIETFISDFSKIDFSGVFNQYLRTTQIPVLEYKIDDKQLYYRWKNVVSNFNMPLKITINSKVLWIEPKNSWSEMILKEKILKFSIDNNFYIESNKKTNPL